MKGFKFVATLVSEFKNIQSCGKIQHGTFYLNPKTETIINENDIDDVFQSFYSTIIIKYTKISRARFMLGYWLSHRSYN